MAKFPVATLFGLAGALVSIVPLVLLGVPQVWPAAAIGALTCGASQLAYRAWDRRRPGED